jgi:hypothetical protein
MQLPPLLQQLLNSKSGIIKLTAFAVALLLLLLVFAFSNSQKPDLIVLPPVVEEVAKPVPPAPPNVDNSKIILELFNPSDESLTHQQNETSYSQQIEQTLTVTFVLTKCQALSQDDYANIFRALIIYAQQVKLAPDAAGAEARVREIAESSNASYSLVYSRTSCEDPQLTPLATEVVEWADRMFKLN